MLDFSLDVYVQSSSIDDIVDDVTILTFLRPHFGMSTCATKTSRSIEYGTLFRVIIDYDPIRAAGCPIDICQEVQQILEDNLTGMTVQVEHNGVCS